MHKILWPWYNQSVFSANLFTWKIINYITLNANKVILLPYDQIWVEIWILIDGKYLLWMQIWKNFQCFCPNQLFWNLLNITHYRIQKGRISNYFWAMSSENWDRLVCTNSAYLNFIKIAWILSISIGKTYVVIWNTNADSLKSHSLLIKV